MRRESPDKEAQPSLFWRFLCGVTACGTAGLENLIASKKVLIPVLIPVPFLLSSADLSLDTDTESHRTT